MIPEPFESQIHTTQCIIDNKGTLVQSDPGTGKTRAVLDAIKQMPGRTLVLGNLSILQPSWGMDIEKFTPERTYAIAHGKYREAVMRGGTDIVVTNHDAVNWIVKDLSMITDSAVPFTNLIIDESTAFKHRTSNRSKAVLKISTFFNVKVLMSGTMMPNSILDMWHQGLLCDGGERLGTKFWKFRDQVCMPEQTGPQPNMVKWVNKPGAIESVADALRDITVRFKLEDCIDMPEHVVTMLAIDGDPKVMKMYRELAKKTRLEMETGTVSAINAAALATKLSQLMSGAAYDAEGEVIKIHRERYKLVVDLIREREQCLVAFNWTHEKEALIQEFQKAGISHRVIDGKVGWRQRGEIVRGFQAGEFLVLLAQPQAASHGLTLTKATTTIWCSPTPNAEHFTQFNHRIYRAGQTRRTETVCIATKGTREEHIYELLEGKTSRQDLMLDILTNTIG